VAIRIHAVGIVPIEQDERNPTPDGCGRDLAVAC
jgi:hypothetical protein